MTCSHHAQNRARWLQAFSGHLLPCPPLTARDPQGKPHPNAWPAWCRASEPCAEYRRLHSLIDDHLAQLRGEPAEPTPVRNALLASYAAEKIDDRTADPICRCGRSKVVLGADETAAMACVTCDCPPLPHLGLGGQR